MNLYLFLLLVGSLVAATNANRYYDSDDSDYDTDDDDDTEPGFYRPDYDAGQALEIERLRVSEEAKRKEEELVKYKKIDQDWLKRYNEAFAEDAKKMEFKEFFEIFRGLKKDITSTSQEFPNYSDIKDKLEELEALSYGSLNKCNRDSFRMYDKQLEVYKVGYNPAIREYIIRFRDFFWLTCKDKFLASGQPTSSDETNLFPILPYVKAKDELNWNPHHHLEPKAIVDGIIEYMKNKFGKDSGKKRKLTSFMKKVVEPACEDLISRLGYDRIYEIVEAYPNYDAQLDTNNRKMLMSYHVCRYVRTHSSNIADKAVAANTENNNGKSYFKSWKFR